MTEAASHKYLDVNGISLICTNQELQVASDQESSNFPESQPWFVKTRAW